MVWDSDDLNPMTNVVTHACTRRRNELRFNREEMR